MQLRPLYMVRLFYPDCWEVEIEGPSGIEQHNYFFAEGAPKARSPGNSRDCR